MDVILFIVGAFFIWRGSMRISKKTKPWPKSKKTGRIIGSILMLPLIGGIIYGFGLSEGFWGLPSSTRGTTCCHSLAPRTSYINQQYGFQITPPSGWIVIPASALKNENPAAGEIVKFVDSENNIQSIIDVSEITIPGITNEYYDSFTNNMVKDLQNASGYLTVNSYKLASGTSTFYFIESTQKTSKGSGVEHVLQMYVLGNNSQMYLLSEGSDDALWPNFKNEVTNSLLSFSLN